MTYTMAHHEQAQDNCGTAMTTVGDINRDLFRGKVPTQPQPIWKNKRSYQDLIVGCPQGDTGTAGGRVMFMYMGPMGAALAYTTFPTLTDAGIAPTFAGRDEFGAALAPYMDLQDTGIPGFVIGAPGDSANSNVTTQSGAIYFYFVRRRRMHFPTFDWVAYYLTIFVPLTCCFCSYIWGVVYFFWYFRRKPDKIEIMVKAANVSIQKHRKREKLAPLDSKVYVDEYVL